MQPNNKVNRFGGGLNETGSKLTLWLRAEKSCLLFFEEIILRTKKERVCLLEEVGGRRKTLAAFPFTLSYLLKL